MQSGALFAPASDSALDQLSRLQADAPDLPGLAEAWEALRQAGVLATQSALERRDWTAADTQLAGLAQVPGGAVAAAPLAAELAAGRLQETLLGDAGSGRRAPRAELGAGRLSAGSAGAWNRRLGRPRVHRRSDGQPRDLVVVEASPPRRFDAAALAAVAQYRYVPFELDGRIYERRLRLRVRFQLQ